MLEGSFNSMAGSLEHSRDELAASRARIVTAGDQARRADRTRPARRHPAAAGLAGPGPANGRGGGPARAARAPGQLARVGDGLTGALEELRKLSRGIHPAILSEGGLGPALKALARRSAVPVELHVDAPERLPERVEVAAYYVISEALANAAKHANASVAEVEAQARDGLLHLSVRDDGVGGATPDGGSGLVGLADRVQALGGTIRVHSPAGRGTRLQIDLPIRDRPSS